MEGEETETERYYRRASASGTAARGHLCVKTAHNMHALITTRTHGEVRPTRSGI